jgi:hypothetical protein
MTARISLIQTSAVMEEAVYERVKQSESSDIPLLEKEGWLRHKSNIAKLPIRRRRGGQFRESVQA